MRIASFLGRLLWSLVPPCSSLTAGSLVLDFETPATSLQAPGITFEGVEVIEGRVGSSFGRMLSTSTNGTHAAFTVGAKIRFSIPVVKVSALLSLSSISVRLDRKTTYSTAWLRAYGVDKQLIGQATTPLINGVGEPERLDNFNPALISFSAGVPIEEITIDLDDPFIVGGATFFIDDLTLTVQEQLPLTRPVLAIERVPGGSVLLLKKSVWNAQLEQSPQIPAQTWQAIPTTSGYLWIEPTNSAMFFRATR